ncbi:MAG: hypothetical protein LBK67_06060 [Coriobacteriales bacterium]|jgi:hypothetical protein|nr:hypothetical protein [Coriobacteriales bacterium]
MNENIKQTINEFASYYSDYNHVSLEQAHRDFEDYGVIDYIIRWSYLISHGSPHLIARRLTGIVQDKKRLRASVGISV